MEESIGHYSGKTEVRQRNRHSYFQGWSGTQDRKYNPKSLIWRKVKNLKEEIEKPLFLFKQDDKSKLRELEQ